MSLKHEDHNEEASSVSKRRTYSWFPWLMVIILGSMLIFNYLGSPGSNGLSFNGLGWLPILAGLACPLMMLLMMSGHLMGGHKESSGAINTAGTGDAAGAMIPGKRLTNRKSKNR